jgi:hypothetical protein
LSSHTDGTGKSGQDLTPPGDNLTKDREVKALMALDGMKEARIVASDVLERFQITSREPSASDDSERYLG